MHAAYDPFAAQNRQKSTALIHILPISLTNAGIYFLTANGTNLAKAVLYCDFAS